MAQFGLDRRSNRMAFAIWVDADACPVPIKTVIYRAADRLSVLATFVANGFLTLPKSPFLRFQQVDKGFDVADHWIVQQLQPGDLVITQDVPLAAEVVELEGIALNPRGTLYTQENVRELLMMRNAREAMRDTGEIRGGPAPFHAKDVQKFAQALDRFLAQRVR
jgi:uncharacterized protein